MIASVPAAKIYGANSVVSGEAALWKDVQESDTPAAYESFVKSYPSGEYAGAAKFRLSQLNERLAKANEYFKLGLAIQASNFDEAILDFTRAVELNPQFSDAYWRRGMTYNLKQDYDRGILDADKAIALDPKSISAYLVRGGAHTGKREFRQAVTDYTHALTVDPTCEGCLDGRGFAYRKLGLYDAAKFDLNQLIANEHVIDKALYYHERALVYLDARDFDHALADETKAIELDPKFFVYYESRGQVYAIRREFNRALEDFSKAIELVQKNPSLYDLVHNYYHNRGLVHFALRNYALAIADDSKAAEAFSANAILYKNRANAYEAVWDKDRAKSDRLISADLEAKKLSVPYSIVENNATMRQWIENVEAGGLPLNVDGYCKTTYGSYSRAVLAQGNAYSWKCEFQDRGQTKNIDINMDEACKKQYGPTATAKLHDYADSNSWYCVAK